MAHLPLPRFTRYDVAALILRLWWLVVVAWALATVWLLGSLGQ